MPNDQQAIAKFLYDMRVANEKPMDNPDDVTLTLQTILAEIRELGYDWHYEADIELHSIQDKHIMRILSNHFDEVDLYTKDIFLRKIDPKVCPEIIDKALALYLTFGPNDRLTFLGFDRVLSMAKDIDGYYDNLLALLEDGEHFSALTMVCKKLCQKRPAQMLSLIERYSQGVLLIRAIQYMSYFANREEVSEKLLFYKDISESELNTLLSTASYALSVTTFEYWKRLCTVERIRTEARSALRKINKKQQAKPTRAPQEKQQHTENGAEESNILPAYTYPADGPLAALIDWE